MSPVQQASLAWNMEKLTFSRWKLHYIDFVRKNMIWTLSCKLWLYFTLALHPSDQHVLHFITVNKQYFWKIKQFLTNLCDFIKYIMQYNRICVTAKLQLASSYTWQLIRQTQQFYLNVTISLYWVFVITSDCDPMLILVKWWGRNMLLWTF